jgi:hypothetical protein
MPLLHVCMCFHCPPDADARILSEGRFQMTDRYASGRCACDSNTPWQPGDSSVTDTPAAKKQSYRAPDLEEIATGGIATVNAKWKHGTGVANTLGVQTTLCCTFSNECTRSVQLDPQGDCAWPSAQELRDDPQQSLQGHVLSGTRVGAVTHQQHPCPTARPGSPASIPCCHTCQAVMLQHPPLFLSPAGSPSAPCRARGEILAQTA